MNTESAYSLCLIEKSKNPVEILLKLTNSSLCPVHNPAHHILTGWALLTADKRHYIQLRKRLYGN